MLWFYVLVGGRRICKDMSSALVLCVGRGTENMQGHEQCLVLCVGKGDGEYVRT